MLKAAIVLFARQGYLRTTLAEVGREAGYTAGLVSHKFGSKEGLLKAVVSHITQRFAQDQLGENLSTTEATAAIESYIEIYLKEVTLREGPMRALYVIMGEAIGAVPDIRSQIAQLNTNARNFLAEHIQRGVDQGAFSKETNPQAAAALIIGALRGVVMQYLMDPQEFDIERMRDVIRQSVLSGLRTANTAKK